MPGPTITFAFIVATLYGAGFHFLRGGDVRRLALYLMAGWVGFILGQMVGSLMGFGVFNIGPIRMVPASIGAFIALLFAQIIAVRSD